ncbi:MAG TPA: hypothetical protein VF074_22580, partial [Pyrinomonadaceae bacterium]
GTRLTEMFAARSRSLARFSIQLVVTVSAGPPCGGLYLKPPSSGGLWSKHGWHTAMHFVLSDVKNRNGACVTE